MSKSEQKSSNAKVSVKARFRQELHTRWKAGFLAERGELGEDSVAREIGAAQQLGFAQHLGDQM